MTTKKAVFEVFELSFEKENVGAACDEQIAA